MQTHWARRKMLRFKKIENRSIIWRPITSRPFGKNPFFQFKKKCVEVMSCRVADVDKALDPWAF